MTNQNFSKLDLYSETPENKRSYYLPFHICTLYICIIALGANICQKLALLIYRKVCEAMIIKYPLFESEKHMIFINSNNNRRILIKKVSV